MTHVPDGWKQYRRSISLARHSNSAIPVLRDDLSRLLATVPPAPVLSGAPCPGCGRVPGPNEHAGMAEDGKIYHLSCMPPKRSAPASDQSAKPNSAKDSLVENPTAHHKTGAE